MKRKVVKFGQDIIISTVTPTIDDVLYEVECTRTRVSPKEFWAYCNDRFKAKSGNDLTMWIDSYEEWIQPSIIEDPHSCYHSDWDKPLREYSHIRPYDIHLFLQQTYNFIMEFEFDTDSYGHGYLYAIEYRS